MKKLMFAAAVAAGMGAFALESANVVGFQDIKTSKDGAGAEFFKYTFVGMTFENIDANGYFKLGDVKAEGMSAPDEYLYQLTTDTANPNHSSAITYVSLENALSYWGDGEWYTEETLKPYVGWYSLPLPQYPDWVQEGEGTLINDRTYVNGTAFLSNFKGEHEVKFTCSGGVQGSAVNVAEENVKYPILANPTPVDVKIGKVSVSGMAAPDEYIYKLTTDTANPNHSSAITYVSLENALSYWGDGEWYTEETLKPYVGWYSLPLPQYPDWVQEGEGALVNDTLDWKAGEGYLGNFKGDHKLIFNFPKAY